MTKAVFIDKKWTCSKLAYIIVFIGVLVMTSCKTKRIASDFTPEPITALDAIDILKNNRLEYDWWTAKADFDLKSDLLSGSADGSIRMKRDSLIWMVVKKLGIEGARLQADDRQWTAILRQERSYAKGTMRDLPFNLSVLQDLIVGNVIIPYVTDISSIDIQGSNYLLKFQYESAQVEYIIDGRSGLVLGAKILDRAIDALIEVDFSDYKKIEDHWHAHRIFIDAQVGADQNQLWIKLKQIKVNEPASTPFNINPRYQRIDLAF